MDLEFDEADCWVSGVSVVGEFVATGWQANAVHFSLGELDVRDKFGIGYFLSLGVVCLEAKHMVLVN